MEDLAPHAGAWNDLACRAPYALPDQSYAWVASYLEYSLEPEETWSCFLAFQNQVLKGVLPLIITPRKRLGLSCHTYRTPYNDQTASIDCLVEWGSEAWIIPALLERLKHSQPACFCLELRRLPDCSPTLALIRKGLAGVNPVETFDGFGTYVKIEGTFDDYCRRLGTKFTRYLRRLERKFFALPGAALMFLKGETSAEDGLDRFVEVEAASWKCTQGSALCQCASLLSFYTALTKRLRDLGWLEWHFLKAEGKTVAANLAIRLNRSLIILKTCYDEAYAAFSPGAVLFGKMFERVFTGGEVDEVNLLTDYAWNRNWQVDRRSFYNLYIYPNKPIPKIAGYLPQKTRKRVRDWPGARPLYNAVQKCLKGTR